MQSKNLGYSKALKMGVNEASLWIFKYKNVNNMHVNMNLV